MYENESDYKKIITIAIQRMQYAPGTRVISVAAIMQTIQDHPDLAGEMGAMSPQRMKKIISRNLIKCGGSRRCSLKNPCTPIEMPPGFLDRLKGSA